MKTKDEGEDEREIRDERQAKQWRCRAPVRLDL
jgi:hypothetical protein